MSLLHRDQVEYTKFPPLRKAANQARKRITEQ